MRDVTCKTWTVRGVSGMCGYCQCSPSRFLSLLRIGESSTPLARAARIGPSPPPGAETTTRRERNEPLLVERNALFRH